MLKRIHKIGRKNIKKYFIFILFFAIMLLNKGLIAQDIANTYDAKGKRDPFIPLVTSDGRIIEPETLETGTKEIKLRLEGIMYNPSGLSAAVINGGIVKSGELIAGGYQVLEIQQKKVVLIKDNQQVELKSREEK